ncbi:GNAT family N-acetyltransferase [Thiotrichales bacterium 19S11-10]|nr:GNAT family N-acetyltransferase [Thiotrichales bacterium 19S11-10]
MQQHKVPGLDYLIWESKFFEKRMYHVNYEQLTKDNKNLTQSINRLSYDMIQALVPLGDWWNINLLCAFGFKLVDIRYELQINIADSLVVMDNKYLCNNENLMFRQATPNDISMLKILVMDLYQSHSRYYNDSLFLKNRVSEMYQLWTEKAVFGAFDDACWLLLLDNNIVGFASYRYDASLAMVIIGLFGVNSMYQGRGYGSILLKLLIELFKKQGYSQALVVTQADNYSAQSLYQANGFKSMKMSAWLHKWADNKQIT